MFMKLMHRRRRCNARNCNARRTAFRPHYVICGRSRIFIREPSLKLDYVNKHTRENHTSDMMYIRYINGEWQRDVSPRRRNRTIKTARTRNSD